MASGESAWDGDCDKEQARTVIESSLQNFQKKGAKIFGRFKKNGYLCNAFQK